MNILVSYSFLLLVITNSAKCSEAGLIPSSHSLFNEVRVAHQVFEGVKGVTRNAGNVDSTRVLDTMHFDNEHVDLCGPVLCISANLTKGTLRGLRGFDVLKSEFIGDGSKVILDIDINFSSLTLESEYYEMEGNIMGALPLAGKGQLYLEIKDLRLWSKMELNVLEDGTFIEDFENTGFNIKNIYSHTEFDGNIDAIFNAMVEELLVYYLNRFNKAIAAYYTETIKQIINPIL